MHPLRVPTIAGRSQAIQSGKEGLVRLIKAGNSFGMSDEAIVTNGMKTGTRSIVGDRWASLKVQFRVRSVVILRAMSSP